MIISVDSEKAYDKIQHHCIVKTLSKLRLEGNFLNIVKGICEKPITDIILSGNSLKAFPIRSEIRSACLLSILQFNIVLDVQVRTNSQK